MKKRLLVVLLGVVIIASMPNTTYRTYNTYLQIKMKIDEYLNRPKPKPPLENPYEQLTMMDEEIDGLTNRMDIPVVILFTAPYCGYCPEMNVAYKMISNKYDSKKVLLTICDVVECPKVGRKYVKRITPNMVVKKGDKVIEVKRFSERLSDLSKEDRAVKMKIIIDEYLAKLNGMENES